MMTELNFAGGAEFAALERWTWPPHVWLIVAMTFPVNSRHLRMGAALAPFLQHPPPHKALPALCFMCDESGAMGLCRDLPSALITESAQRFVEDRTIAGALQAKQAFAQREQVDRLGKYQSDKAAWGWAHDRLWLAPDFADWCDARCWRCLATRTSTARHATPSASPN